MRSRNYLEKLKKDINDYERRKSTDNKDLIARQLLSTGAFVYRVLPYAVSALLLLNSKSFKRDRPFIIDEIHTGKSHEITQTSTGYYEDKSSFENTFNTYLLEHTTGWKKSENGLYERTVTTYTLNQDINIKDIDGVLQMSKEELERAFEVGNIEIIRKNKLEEEDHLFDEEAIIIIDSFVSDEDYIVSKESGFSNVMNSLLYIFLILVWGFAGSIIIKKTSHNYVIKKIEQSKEMYRMLSEEEIKEIDEIIKRKKKDLELFSSAGIGDDESEPRIRRR